LGEITFNVYYANGKKAALVDECALRPSVDVDGTMRGETVEEPEVAVADWWLGRDKSRMEGSFDNSCG
jgi:hypothetical protein